LAHKALLIFQHVFQHVFSMLSAFILLASKATDKLEQKEPIFSVVLSKKLSLLLSNLKKGPGVGFLWRFSASFSACFQQLSACFQHLFQHAFSSFQHAFSSFQHVFSSFQHVFSSLSACFQQPFSMKNSAFR